MKTIKIIDIAKLIAEERYSELPKKIKIKGYIYEFDTSDKEYRRYEHGSFTPLYEIRKDNEISYFKDLIEIEVEIIEEEKEIEPLVYDEDCTNEWCIKELYEKVYELIDAVNEIRKEK